MAHPLAAVLWIGGILQVASDLAFAWLAPLWCRRLRRLSFAIMVENFTSAIGTVIFVAYLSALLPVIRCTPRRNIALLTALAAVGRTYLSSGAGYIAEATGWPWFFALCALAAVPAFADAGVAAGAGISRRCR